MINPDDQIKIHSNICEIGGRPLEATNVWYLAKYISKGSKKATLYINELAEFLGVSPKTVINRIKSAQSKGFFFALSWHEDEFGKYALVHHTSAIKIAQQYKLEKLGTTAYVNISHLKSAKSLAAASTYATALQSQKSSQYKAEKEHPNKLIDTDQLESTSDNATGRKMVYIDKDSKAFGASQSSLASKLGRSRQTINKRLQSYFSSTTVNQYVELTLDEDAYTWLLLNMNDLGVNFYKTIEHGKEKIIHFFANRYGNKLYRQYTNYYQSLESIILSKSSYLKRTYTLLKRSIGIK